MTRLIDLTGQRFGKLTVLGRSGEYRYRSGMMPRWAVLCDCGARKTVNGVNLRHGRAASCGCSLRPHGMFGTPEYKVWSAMVQRCTNPRSQQFRNYGGRGISVCQEWRESFTAFLAHIGLRPSNKHSLDRIDNNGNYEPGNVRWATIKVQMRNRRVSRVLTVGGVSRCMSEWAEVTGIGLTTIRERLSRGWTTERALGFE